MKEIIGVILQMAFLLIGLGIAFLLLYFGIKSPRQNETKNLDLKDTDVKEKFIGRT